MTSSPEFERGGAGVDDFDPLVVTRRERATAVPVVRGTGADLVEAEGGGGGERCETEEKQREAETPAHDALLPGSIERGRERRIGRAAARRSRNRRAAGDQRARTLRNSPIECSAVLRFGRLFA